MTVQQQRQGLAGLTPEGFIVSVTGDRGLGWIMIRALVADEQALAARSPAELWMYLRSTGWQLEGRNGILARWTRSAGDAGEFEIVQPLDPASRDYASRVGDALATLAVAEGRSQLDVLHEITQVPADVD